MYEINKENKWLVLSDGRNVIHGPIENTTETVTTSGQKFAIFGDTKEYVVDLAFDEYLEEEDENGNKLVSKTLRDIKWLVDYTYQEAETARNNFNTASINAKIEYIKHPNREEYALPMQDYIFSTIPDGTLKDGMVEVATDKITTGKCLDTQQMIEQGWF